MVFPSFAAALFGWWFTSGMLVKEKWLMNDKRQWNSWWSRPCKCLACRCAWHIVIDLFARDRAWQQLSRLHHTGIWVARRMILHLWFQMSCCWHGSSHKLLWVRSLCLLDYQQLPCNGSGYFSSLSERITMIKRFAPSTHLICFTNSDIELRRV